MLSVAFISAGQGYYYTQLGRDDFYLEGGEPPGRWVGEGSGHLNLEGRVDPTELHNLLLGYSPDGESALVSNAGGRTRRAGLDLTFSADKSVSVLWALSGEEARADIEWREAGSNAIIDCATHTLDA